MSWTVKMVYVLVIILFTWLYQEENQEWDLLRNLLKDSNNLAVHDAGQAIDYIELANGRLIIDKMQARSQFEDTLQLNLGLNDELQPIPGSRLKNPVRIVEFIVIDETNAGDLCSQITNNPFPCLYDNSEYKISKLLNGPAVVAIVETAHPKFVAWSINHKPIRVPAIYEYKPNQ